nr:MAG TPA: hypothetical protein [Caudoviricetes sp.]
MRLLENLYKLYKLYSGSAGLFDTASPSNANNN